MLDFFVDTSRNRPDMSVMVRCKGCQLKFQANLNRSQHLPKGSAMITRPCPYCEQKNTFRVTVKMSPQTLLPGR